MAHLIDKDALVAKIEKRQSILDLDSPFGQGGMIELELLKDILNTLEVKEVDLEKEINDYHITKKPTVWFNTLEEIAKHFFELGLKVQKGE